MGFRLRLHHEVGLSYAQAGRVLGLAKATVGKTVLFDAMLADAILDRIVHRRLRYDSRVVSSRP